MKRPEENRTAPRLLLRLAVLGVVVWLVAVGGPVVLGQRALRAGDTFLCSPLFNGSVALPNGTEAVVGRMSQLGGPPVRMPRLVVLPGPTEGRSFKEGDRSPATEARPVVYGSVRFWRGWVLIRYDRDAAAVAAERSD